MRISPFVLGSSSAVPAVVNGPAWDNFVSKKWISPGGKVSSKQTFRSSISRTFRNMRTSSGAVGTG